MIGNKSTLVQGRSWGGANGAAPPPGGRIHGGGKMNILSIKKNFDFLRLTSF